MASRRSGRAASKGSRTIPSGGSRSAPTAAKSSKPAAKKVKANSAGADKSTGAMLEGIELSDLRRLIRLVQHSGIGELEVSSGGRTVRIAAHAGTMPVAHAPAAHAPAPRVEASGPAATPASDAESRAKAITSPMVGTFYRAPAPDADPYVEVGDIVEVGQTVCIVEAMKLMNEIESEVRGRIVQIVATNEQPVEFGQKLFLVEPQ
jgi:acetyl-CoA carboxylase biotin carboxyl carrier protein